MDLSGEYRIAASRKKVWDGLNDPAVLSNSIPGAESLEKVDDNTLQGTVNAKVGPVKAKFTGTVTLSELDPPNGYRISGEGKGGVAGFAKGSAKVTLAEDGPDVTLLTYTADAQVGGKLAQIGSRLIQGTARKMADDFFSRFSAQMESAMPIDEEEAEAPSAAEELIPDPAPEPIPVEQGATDSDGGISPAYWVVGIIAIIVLLLLIFR